MLLNFSITTIFSPETLARGSFKYLLDIHFTPEVFAGACGVAGIVRMIALYFNGYGLPWSARVRALTAIFGAVIFALMGLALTFLTKDTYTVSLGAGTHFLLAVVELYSCLRAGADVNEKLRRNAVLDAARSGDARHNGGSRGGPSSVLPD